MTSVRAISKRDRLNIENGREGERLVWSLLEQNDEIVHIQPSEDVYDSEKDSIVLYRDGHRSTVEVKTICELSVYPGFVTLDRKQVRKCFRVDHCYFNVVPNSSQKLMRTMEWTDRNKERLVLVNGKYGEFYKIPLSSMTLIKTWDVDTSKNFYRRSTSEYKKK